MLLIQFVLQKVIRNQEKHNLNWLTYLDHHRKMLHGLMKSNTLVSDINKIQFKGTLEGRFNCDKCEGQFKSKSHLKRHIQSMHEGIKYACNQCDLKFSQKCSLYPHIKSKHEGVKYVCNQCDQQFTQQSNLSRHVKLMHKA